MKSLFWGCLSLMSALAVASCSGGSGDSAPGAVTSLDVNPSIPGFASRQVDIYDTSVADKAVVFLHGGGGTNYGVAHDLGLNSNDGAPDENSVNWDWLNSNKVIAVFPQGKAATPGGTATWNNYVMTSGPDSGQTDDVAFLQALAAYIKSQYGVSSVYLAGHSNGGMMVNRMWCESPSTFAAYISFAGPASDHYLTTACAPSVAKPYYGVVGSADTVLQTSGHWTDPTWTINPTYVNASTPGSFVDATPTLISEWSQQQTRINQMAGCSELLSNTTGSTTSTANGSVTTWTNCGGRLELAEVIPADHWINYLPGTNTVASNSLESIAGTDLIDLAVQFISANGG